MPQKKESSAPWTCLIVLLLFSFPQNHILAACSLFVSVHLHTVLTRSQSIQLPSISPCYLYGSNIAYQIVAYHINLCQKRGFPQRKATTWSVSPAPKGFDLAAFFADIFVCMFFFILLLPVFFTHTQPSFCSAMMKIYYRLWSLSLFCLHWKKPSGGLVLPPCQRKNESTAPALLSFFCCFLAFFNWTLLSPSWF